MNPILVLDSLETRLSNGATVVDRLSLTIAAGETFVLLGESGCGKSMTALSLMRLLPDGIQNVAGKAVLNGVDLLALSEAEMCRVRGGQIGMIFQEPALSLNPVLTVGQQLMEVLQLHQPDLAKQAYCIQLLQQVGIADPVRRVDEYPFQLSGGMKQRVMIAMALAGKPKLLIADEPTTALDVTMQAQVLQLLREQQQAHGMGLLMITHDLGVVAEMAHHVGVMYAGRLVEVASRQQLFSRPLHPYTRKLFAAMPDASRRGVPLAAIPGSVPAIGGVQQGCAFASRCELAQARCVEQAPPWTALPTGGGVACFAYQQELAVASDPEMMEPLGALSGVPLLALQDLKVHFPIRKGILQRVVGQVKAVDGVELSIAAGRTLALVGESGCGKTTLGKALLQLHSSTAGSIHFDGHSLMGLSSAELRQKRAGMQMVFQDPYASLNPKMRVAEILEEGMAALNIASNPTQRQARIDQLLLQVGLSVEAKWRYPHEFSGGQRQRIAIARALAVEPKLLICDEPTSALDVSVQAQILNLLKQLQQQLGLAYLFITHNISVVEYLADEVAVMYLGRIVEQGACQKILVNPQHPYTQALLSAVPRVDGKLLERIRLNGELPSPANQPRGCFFAPRCPQAQAICHQSYPPKKQGSDGRFIACHLI